MTLHRRDIDFPDLDAVVADAQSLHEKGYHPTGQWDLTQVCLHLATSLNSTIDGFAFRLSPVTRLFIRVMGMKKGMFRTRKIRAGLAAPQAMIFEPAGDDRQKEAQAAEALAKAVARFQEGRGRYVSHPVFGAMSDQEWNQFHTIHATHHLSLLVSAGVS